MIAADAPANVRSRRGAPPASASPLADLLQFVNDGVLQPMLRGFDQAAGNLSARVSSAALARSSSTGAMRSAPMRREERCGCQETASCECECCVGDADCIVYARLGERRIVPLEIENPRRREIQVTLAQGPWTTASGAAAPIRSQIVPETSFVLAPCTRHEVDLLIDFTAAPAAGQPVDGQKLPDVDRCEVYYSDLRIDGCGVRPVRLAVAVLPRACGPFPIDCRCGCC